MKCKIILILGLFFITFVLSCKNDSVVNSAPAPSKSDEEVITPEEKTVTYTVNHYQQNITDDEYILFESEQLVGIEGEYTNASAKSYEHFSIIVFSQKKIEANCNNNISIYYDRDIISLIFNSNGGIWSDGSNDIKSLSGRYGAPVNFNEIPTKTGYGTIWDKEIQTTFSYDETYCAIYDAGIMNYKVEHYKQNIEDDSYPDEPYSTELKIGRTGSLTEAVAKSYEGFISPKIIQQSISGDGNTVIRVEYEREKYTVNFNTKGGNDIVSQSVKYGAKVTVPINPVKTHYDFKGWYLSNNGGITLVWNSFNFETEITGEITLYAKWEEKTYSYTVKHLWQNIEDDNYTEKEIENLSGKYGSQTVVLAKNYTGFTPQTITQQIISEQTPIVEVYYNRNVYTVSFNSKNGTDVMTQSVRYGGKSVVPQVPTKNPYDFIGWYTSNDNGKTFAEDTFDFKNFSITCDITLYAKWFLDLSNCTADNVIAKIRAITWDSTVVVKGEITSQLLSEIKNEITASYPSIIINLDLFETSGLDTIPRYAFQECKHLYSITLPAGVKSIENYGFYKCPNLRTVILPEGLTSIGYEAFMECENLSNIVIPNGVTTIGQEAFHKCKNLRNITIPETVTSLGSYAFAFSGLESITIPGNVRGITIYTFCGCDNLTSAIIENGVSTIGQEAFSGCSALSNITIPASVTAIRKVALGACKNLTDIIFLGTREQWNAIEKDEYWNWRKGYPASKIPATKIVCIDGDVDL